MAADDVLPSWRTGATRDAVEGFLEAASTVPAERRVAVFDNDGTLWCEKPRYVQEDFLLHELSTAAKARPELAQRPEYRALLHGDQAALAELGLQRVAAALIELSAGLTPEEFAHRVTHFMKTGRHPDYNVPYGQIVYQPMLELMDALRAKGFTIGVVTGGGTEFVRAVAPNLYGVPPELVVGTLIEYAYQLRDGAPVLLRTAKVHGQLNEGKPKVSHIQAQLGRRPIFAAGNSAGDREMLEYTADAGPASLALLINHDDHDREYAYQSRSVTLDETESIVDVARREGWAVASMRNDWTTVIGPGSH
ncbi:haloacid dehalogenase-like hydrolase [Micromonospora sp. CPCC 205371]|nr:haloacid dehalogenase-like hydrolase [Micromonospora sp. CPCC 205371]